jgi:glycosyltransferase involved in cell wall biosynthesis
MTHSLAKPENGGRPRLLYVVHHGYPLSSDGYSVRTQCVARGLMDNGWDVLVATQPGTQESLHAPSPLPPGVFSHDHDGVPYEHTLEPRLEGVPYGALHDCLSAIHQEKIRQFKPHAILAASNWQVAQPAMDAARREGVPFYYEVRGFWELSQLSRDPDYRKSAEFSCHVTEETRVCVAAEAVFTLNEAMRKELLRRGVQEQKIGIVPNGIGHTKKNSHKCIPRENLGLKSKYIVGYIGSFNGYEGLEDLVQAAANLYARGLDISLLLVGGAQLAGVVPNRNLLPEDPHALALCNLAESLRFEDRLVLTGRVSAEQAWEYYSCMDLVVIPRRPSEVTELVPPIKPLEALAAGKQVLMSDVSPLKEIASMHSSFRCFQKGNMESLTREIEKILLENRDTTIGVRNLSRLSWNHILLPMMEKIHTTMSLKCE